MKESTRRRSEWWYTPMSRSVWRSWRRGTSISSMLPPTGSLILFPTECTASSNMAVITAFSISIGNSGLYWQEPSSDLLVLLSKLLPLALTKQGELKCILGRREVLVLLPGSLCCFLLFWERVLVRMASVMGTIYSWMVACLALLWTLRWAVINRS